MFPFIQCQFFDKRRGVFFTGKSQLLKKIRVLFWPDISALGVFLNFDNERMHPLYTKVAPPACDWGMPLHRGMEWAKL